VRKLVLLVAIVAAMSLGAVACGGGEEPTDTPTTNPTPSLPPTGGTPTPQAGTPQPTGTGTAPSPQEGQQVAQSAGCLACHTVDGSPSVGPTWQGLFGSTETLADGSTVQVDEQYLHESIVDPNAKIVEGFAPGLMPQDYEQSLTEQEIQAIIEYIKSLQ
jgi:cytochrome c oxidase subunit 2